LPHKAIKDESRSTIIIELQGVTGLLTTVADRIFQSEISISQTQFAVLLTIDSLKSPVNESQVAEKLHRRINTTSMMIERLFKAGMIERTRSTTDRRLCVLSLTPSGEDKLAKGKRINEALAKQLFSVLDDKDVQDIHTLLSKLETQAVKELSV
jgi:DNA-binding MarR family transcriptional regulator